MKTVTKILKFTLDLRCEKTIQMPPDAKILFVDHQHHRMTAVQVGIWAECKLPANGQFRAGDRCEPRSFLMIGTGHEFPEEATSIGSEHCYIGSAMTGEFVWHVYEDRGALEKFRKDTHVFNRVADR